MHQQTQILFPTALRGSGRAQPRMKAKALPGKGWVHVSAGRGHRGRNNANDMILIYTYNNRKAN